MSTSTYRPNVLGVLQAVRAAARADREHADQICVECLGLLASATGAARACLCLFDSNDPDAVVHSYLSKGDPGTLPVGPAVLGLSLKRFPYLLELFADSRHCVVRLREEFDAGFESLLQGLACDWIIAGPLQSRGETVAVLFLMGVGVAPEVDPLICPILDTMAELLVSAVKPTAATEAANQDSAMIGTTPAESPDLTMVEGCLLLTLRQREVLDMIASGMRVDTIAKRLYVSPHTVRNHLKAIFRQLGVKSQSELMELLRRASTTPPLP